MFAGEARLPGDCQLAVISPEREKIEGEADQEQRNREMDQEIWG